VLKLLFFSVGCLSFAFCFAQKNYGVSQDYYVYPSNDNCIVPFIYYEAKNGWYGSIRYNYESDKTTSFQIGKKFSKDGKLSYSATPLVGALTGKFKGISMSALTEIETGKFSFYSEPEYCIGFHEPDKNFFYSWTELSFQPHHFFFTGLALQIVKPDKGSFDAEPGIVFAFNAQNFEIPFYFFRPSRSSNYFIAGIHWSLNK
jgi:hypothetical protein